MIKKIISVILSIMLLASMFTGVVFAESTSASVKHYYSVWFKSTGAATENNSYLTWWGDRTSYSLYDFKDVLPYIYGADSIQGSAAYSYRIYGISVTALDDKYEQYINSELTWSGASSYGMLNSGYKIAEVTDTTEKTSLGFDVDKEALIAALETGDNDIVGVRFSSVAGGQNSQSAGVTLTFNYDNATYMDKIASGFEWSDVSSYAQDAIAGNLELPSKYAGCDVTWQSNSSAIDASTGKVTMGSTAQSATLTATLSHNGNTASKSFDVIIPVGYVSPQTYVGNPQVGLHVRNAGGADTDTINAPTSGYYQIQLNGYNTGFISYDFAGNEAAVYAAKELTFNVNSTYSSERVRKLNIYAVNDSLESAFSNQLTWNIANNSGLLSGGTLIGQYTGEPGWSVSVDIDKEALASALKQNPANSKLVLRLVDASGSTSSINWTSAKFTFKYDAADASYADYLNNLVTNLNWSDISSQPENEITENITFPEKIYGADVVWTSANNAITNAGVVTAQKGAAVTGDVTATITYGGESLTKTFNLTVPGIAATASVVPTAQEMFVRGGSYADTVQSYEGYGAPYLVIGPGVYYAFTVVDFAGYEEIINSASSAKYSITTGGPYGSTVGRAFKIVVLPDSMEKYIAADGTYNSVSAGGLIDATGAVIGTNPDTLARGTVFTGDNFIDALKAAIAENPGNSKVAFAIQATVAGDSYLHKNSSKVTLEYYPEDVLSKDEFFEAKKDTLTWSQISNQPQDAVKENLTLPEKFYGFDVTWTSDNDAVTTEGIVTRGDTTQKAKLTATVSYGEKSWSKEFNVTVAKYAYDYGANIYDATNSKRLSVDGGSANFKAVPEENVFGKEVSDKAFGIYSNGAAFGYFTDAIEGNDHVFEFSAYVPENAGGLSFNIGIKDGSQYGAQILFRIANNALYNNYGDNQNKICSISPEEWHTYALVAPKGDGEDNTYEFYVDGVCIMTSPVATTTEGFRHIRVYGLGGDINAVSGYMDNMRLYSGEYNHQYDLNPEFTSTYDIAGRIITVTQNATVADLKAAITADEDAKFEIKDAMGNVVTDESAVLTDGIKVCFTTTNGTEIDKNYSVYIVRNVVGEYVIDTPVITVNGDSVSAKFISYNFTDADEDYTVILAVYSDEGELVSLGEPTKVDSVSGKKAEITLTAAYEKGCYMKALVWDNMDDITPILTATIR